MNATRVSYVVLVSMKPSMFQLVLATNQQSALQDIGALNTGFHTGMDVVQIEKFSTRSPLMQPLLNVSPLSNRYAIQLQLMTYCLPPSSTSDIPPLRLPFMPYYLAIQAMDMLKACAKRGNI